MNREGHLTGSQLQHLGLVDPQNCACGTEGQSSNVVRRLPLSGLFWPERNTFPERGFGRLGRLQRPPVGTRSQAILGRIWGPTVPPLHSSIWPLRRCPSRGLHQGGWVGPISHSHFAHAREEMTPIQGRRGCSVSSSRVSTR